MDKSFWKGKKVFLTGHTGFKGSWMTQWLLNLGAEVYGYALAPNTEPSHYLALELSSKIKETIDDIRDFPTLEGAVRDFDPDIIFHLAAQPLVRLSYEEPLETFETNVMGTANLMNAARSVKNLQCVVVITTDKCYKNKEWDWPYRESDELGGHDPYSNSKACSELVVDSFRDSFFSKTRVKVATARAGNVVGGGDWSANRLIPDMMKASKNGETMEVRSPNSVRPWQHVLEPICGYLTLAEKLCKNNVLGQSFNFGPDTSDTVTVLNILNTAKEIMGEKFRFEVNVDPNAPHEAGLLKLDSSKAKSLLNWEPRMDLNDTINKVIEWYNIEAESPELAPKITQDQISWYESLLK